MFEQIPNYVQQYLPIIVFLGIALIISIIAIYIPLIFAENKPDREKLSACECNFEAFTDVKNKFNVRFYLVAVLFIIFSAGIMFLFPWAVTLKQIGIYGFWSMIVFLSILIVGFIYAWKKGALEQE
jgi:NADH-quinone oxidoreductase subunit A